MCGIVGFIDVSKKTDEKTLNSMRDSLVHRGPDAYGSFIFNNLNYKVGLGHRRLSILDLSSIGNQPMEFEHLTIVYNGEVYNFEDIRNELKKEEYSFTSHTDTEVILKAFHKWGVKAVEKFRGMFAFVIYNKKEDKLYIFRDRVGVKPLYYYKKDDLFLFGSELKTFYKHPKFEKVLNKKALPYYFRFGYIPAPLSIFENTYKLKQGYYLEIDCQSLKVKESPYWKAEEFFLASKLDKTEDEVLEELENILKESFKLRMVSDVPVGVFLSGGIDSTLVTAILQNESSKPINTFTIGFYEKEYNEANHAKEIANYLGTNHTEYYCLAKDMLDVVKDLSTMYDEPFGDSSAIPTFLISKLAKEKVSVVLSGDGGDEIFLGYSKYKALNNYLHSSSLKKTLLKITTQILNNNSVELLNSFLPNNKKQKNIKDKFTKFKNSIQTSNIYEMFFNASSYVDNETLNHILKDNNIDKNTNFNLKIFEEDNLNDLELFSLIDYKTFLPDDVLVKVDRASMFVSIEAREPLLDHKIMEYSSKIPLDIKFQDNSPKYLLKQILYKYIPKELMERPKSGFQIPLLEWLRGDLKELLDSYLQKEKLEKSGIYNVEYILKLKRDLYKGKDINLSILWFILMFEMWKERWKV